MNNDDIIELTQSSSIRRASTLKRSRYGFRKLAHGMPVFDSNEPLAKDTALQKHGLSVAPIWHDEPNIEGDAYLRYIKCNPGFSVSVRTSVMQRLVAAQKALPSGWQLVIKAGLRPRSVQQDLFDSLKAQTRASKPTWNNQQLLAHVRTYVSDPKLTISPHTTGGAVDVVVLDDKTKQLVDMGCAINQDTPLAFCYNPALPHEAANNRKLLLSAMLDAGFANLAYEWWHFSYGDQYWAAFYNKPHALYSAL